MDVCMVLGYNRPECLQICLEHVATNHGFKNLFYLFVLDNGSRREHINRLVIYNWVKKHGLEKQNEVFRVPPDVKGIAKQSHAVFRGYQRASELSTNLVFMVEEDVAVSNRFFEWHYKVQNENKPFCSIGTTNNNVKVEPTKYGDYYLQSNYQSLGVCWQKENLNEVLLKHANREYYNDPFKYVAKHWPNSPHWQPHPIGFGLCEQDSIFHRYIIKEKKDVAFPKVGVGYHYGIYGTNRKVQRLTGTLEQKVDKLKQIIYSKAKMREVAPDEGAYLDSIPVPLNITPEMWDGSINKV